MTQIPLMSTTQPARRTMTKAEPITLDRELVSRVGLLMLPFLAVSLAGIAGYCVLSGMGQATYAAEMIGAVIINGMGGFFAVGALLIVADKGAAVISRTALLGTTMRMIGVLTGTLVAMGPGWDLMRMPLLYWVLVLYFVMLIAESFVGIRLVRAAKH